MYTRAENPINYPAPSRRTNSGAYRRFVPPGRNLQPVANSQGGLGALSYSAKSLLADEITRIEGYYPGSVAYRNNNPGNLMYVGQAGAVLAPEGFFAKFPTAAAGRAALENQIQIYADRGLTISGMTAIYAPKGHGNNDPVAYANAIAGKLGVSPDTPLSSLDGGPSLLPSFSLPSFDLSSLFPESDFGFDSSGNLIPILVGVFMVTGLVMAVRS